MGEPAKDFGVHRGLALAAQARAEECETIAVRLRSLTLGLSDALRSPLEALGPEVWTSRAATNYRIELHTATVDLAAAQARVADQATDLDQAATRHRLVAAWHWERYFLISWEQR